MTEGDDRRVGDDGGDRVNLPLDPEDALRALLAVDPESEPADDENDDESGGLRDDRGAPD
jgi:hypothetical protein